MTAEMHLSETQRRIVDFDEGPLLVIAGPGSGKTRVLTERVRRLVTDVKGHFRILALTFTNKAANELKDRLKDLPGLKQKAFIGTLHGFCLDLLCDRGKPVGVSADAQIFDNYADRRQVLVEAIAKEPVLRAELLAEGDPKKRNLMVDDWLKAIAHIKAHPVSMAEVADPLASRLFETYNAELRANGAFDFEDLLLLTHQLLTEYPAVADFYRRLYRFICIDEAQDLNEAQYQVVKALCGDDYNNVMMVGDPKQSIYGFNTASPKYMEAFGVDFKATTFQLNDNYRSAQSIVTAASALEPNYSVAGRLPIKGQVSALGLANEEEEAKTVVTSIQHLIATGHPDVEGTLTPTRFAILGRTRFALLAVEKALSEAKIPFYRRLSVTHENESPLIDDFVLLLRVAANPRDALHLSAIAKRWKVDAPAQSLKESSEVMAALDGMAAAASSPNAAAVVASLKTLLANATRLDIPGAVTILRLAADQRADKDKQAIYKDTEVLLQEWDQYLRSGGKKSSISTFMSSMALGVTQQPNMEGVALLTVHSAKGLEFDVVFLVGMADGVFPDYRAQGSKTPLNEERRNAFVAITRSKRLLFLSFPRTRKMPWGETWAAKPSPYLRDLGFYL